MVSIDGSQIQIVDDAAHQTIKPVQPELADLVGIARRGWHFIVAGTALGLICALMLVSIIPPSYKASARIMFERTLPRYMQANKVTNEPVIDEYDTLGQSYAISSESILLQVVRSLSLASDPDFARGEEKDSKTLGSRVRDLFRNIMQALGFPKEQADDQSIHHSNDPEKIAFDSVTRNLTVGREDVASVITIAFSWKDPVKAATIANAVVDTYINDSIAEKMKSANVARRVAQERAEELKQQVKDADRALFEYKAANNILGTEFLMLSHGQLNVVQTQMTNAQLAMAEAKHRMERIAGDPDASSFLAPDNESIKKLRGELVDLSIRANDIEKLVGKDHRAAVKARDRIEETRGAIASEQRRIAGSFGKDYELARARYDELSATASQVISSEGANSNAQARVRELESAVETLRGLYNRMLQQVNETNKVDAQPSIAPDARVLMHATPPLQTESSKKRLLILAGGSVMGLLLGAAFVLARNFPFGVFRTSQQVTDATGLPCVVLPEISNADEQSSLRTGEYGLDWPYSRFAQTLRSIWATINVAQRDSGAKVVCVVSSNPGEGKTTVAINLAAHFALHSTTRVLVVDADFHRQTLTNRVAPDARVGFREALEEPTALAKFVVRKERMNLDALPCPVPDRIPNAAELFGSVQMEQLIEVAREAYDLVIIEAPPIAAVVDYKMIARHCDGFIFVVEWGKTSQRLVLECLSDASAVMDRVLCVVLNKVDSSALRSIEHYKGDGFHAYYGDQPPAWRRLVVSSIAAAMISSSLIGIYFRAPIAAYVTQYAAQHDLAKIGRIVEQPSRQTIPLPVRELQQADLSGRAPTVQARGKSDGSEQTVASEAVQTTMVSQATEILEKERRRADGVENALAEVPPSIDGRELRLRDAAATAPQSQEPDREKTSALLQDLAAARQELTASELQYRKALAEERDRSTTLASELATAQRNVDTQVVRSNKTANEATELKKAADTAASELQRERERAEALASELGKVRREVEAAAAVSSQKDDEAAQLKRKAETATAELQQSLQQERDKAQALESELAKVRQNADAQVATLRKMNEEAALRRQVSSSNQVAEYAKAEPRPSLHQERGQPNGNAPKAEPTRKVAGTAAAEQSVSTEAKGSEAAGLLARAKALLDQGNIGAARVVLERAAETGSAQATFALAETYDPNVLATWRTYGTRGDGTKARDLYARAYDGGVKAAKDRSDALVIGDGADH